MPATSVTDAPSSSHGTAPLTTSAESSVTGGHTTTSRTSHAATEPSASISASRSSQNMSPSGPVIHEVAWTVSASIAPESSLTPGGDPPLGKVRPM